MGTVLSPLVTSWPLIKRLIFTENSACSGYNRGVPCAVCDCMRPSCAGRPQKYTRHQRSQFCSIDQFHEGATGVALGVEHLSARLAWHGIIMKARKLRAHVMSFFLPRGESRNVMAMGRTSRKGIKLGTQ